MRAFLLGSTSLALALSAAHAQSAASLTDWAGVSITPIDFSSATTVDYATYTAVAAGSQPDINPLDTTAWTLAFADNFSSLSAYDPATGAGTWLLGSTYRINDETEFYPTAAQIAAVGSSPLAVQNGVLDINLTQLNPGYAPLVQSSAQLWQSGRLDTSMLPGLYSEGGKLYIEVTAQVPSSPYAWPAFWALAKDAIWPFEYDAVEVFGQPQTSYDATIHYLSTNSTGNNSIATRVYTNGADLAASYHVYGFLADRNARTLSAYFDHHFVGSMPVTTDAQGFDKEVYLILNEATGGQVPSPPAGTALPLTFKVKQVAAYYNVDTTLPAPVSYYVAQPETVAYARQLPTLPSWNWLVAFNNMIVAAKNLGFFTAPYRPAHWWVFATEHQADGLVDIMNPAAPPITMQGVPLGWTADRGFVGNGGLGWIDTGLQLAATDETNTGMGAWITQAAFLPATGGLIETRAPGNDLRLETAPGNAVVYDLGLQYGAQSETAPDTSLGWFGLSTFANAGSTYADKVTLMAGAGNGVGNEPVASATRLPASDVLLLAGTDGAAAIVLGNQWHQPRQVEFRDQVLKPFLQAVGAIPD